MINKNITDIIESVEKLNRNAVIVAAIKRVPTEKVNEIAQFGILNVGENKAAEFASRKDMLDSRFTKHFIGHLQTNKVSMIVGQVELIQSIDSCRVLEAVNKEASVKGICQQVLLEVNVSGEQSKYGFSPEETEMALETALGLPCIRVRGFMTMAPFMAEEKAVRGYFAHMYRIFDRYKSEEIDTLSMGMSLDYKYALMEGANMVRLGTAIFGRRE